MYGECIQCWWMNHVNFWAFSLVTIIFMCHIWDTDTSNGRRYCSWVCWVLTWVGSQNALIPGHMNIHAHPRVDDWVEGIILKQALIVSSKFVLVRQYETAKKTVYAKIPSEKPSKTAIDCLDWIHLFPASKWIKFHQNVLLLTEIEYLIQAWRKIIVISNVNAVLWLLTTPIDFCII